MQGVDSSGSSENGPVLAWLLDGLSKMEQNFVDLN